MPRVWNNACIALNSPQELSGDPTMGINSRGSDGLTENSAAEQQAGRLSGEPALAKGVLPFTAHSSGEMLRAASTSRSRLFRF